MNLFPIEQYAPEDYHPEYSLYIHAGEDRISLDGDEAAAYDWNPFTVGEDEVLLSSGGVSYWHQVIVTELDRVNEGTRVRMVKEK